MIERHESVVVTTFTRVVLPPVQTFALYVLVHGHESPGGGFQAGVILGASYILLALALGREAFEARIGERACLAGACAGVLLYVAVGLAPMALGGVFLDYAALPVPGPAARARYFGILVIEVGVTLTVAATLVLIFRCLGDRDPEPRT
jgi:multicomponent Na+:H+ antiporter subunit B